MTYFKGALGLVLLREQILGPARFDPAFRKYIATWAFKHPTPSDFFRLMESESGEDLSWWWRGWYFNNWQLDMGISEAHYVDQDPAKGVQVTLRSRQRLVMPVTLRADLADGSHLDRRVPVEAWLQQTAPKLTLATTQKVLRVRLTQTMHCRMRHVPTTRWSLPARRQHRRRRAHCCALFPDGTHC